MNTFEQNEPSAVWGLSELDFCLRPPLGSQRLSRSSGAFCVTQRFSKVRDDPNRLQSTPSGPRVSVLNSESQSNGSILFLLGISCCPYYRGERKATVDCTRCSTHHPLTLHTTKILLSNTQTSEKNLLHHCRSFVL